MGRIEHTGNMTNRQRDRPRGTTRRRDPGYRLAVLGHGQGAIFLLVRRRPAWRCHRLSSRQLRLSWVACMDPLIGRESPKGNSGREGPRQGARGLERSVVRSEKSCGGELCSGEHVTTNTDLLHG